MDLYLALRQNVILTHLTAQQLAMEEGNACFEICLQTMKLRPDDTLYYYIWTLFSCLFCDEFLQTPFYLFSNYFDPFLATGSYNLSDICEVREGCQTDIFNKIQHGKGCRR